MTTPIIIPAASAAVFKEKKVLIVLRSKGAAKDKWSLPGGHIILPETSEEAAAREVLEETGITARILNQIDTLNIPVTKEQLYRLNVFIGLWVSGDIKAASDAAEARWISPENLNRLPCTDNLPAIVEKALSTLPQSQ